MQQSDSIGHRAFFTPPPFLPEQYCSFSIHGDSMEPDFKSGALLAVDKFLAPEASNYVVAESDGLLLFRQLVEIHSERYLKPLNDRYPTRLLQGFNLIGTVIWFGYEVKS